MDQELTRTFELIRGAQGGDARALNRLFERYYGRVNRVVRLRLGRRLRARIDSGDILQETFLAALRSFENFEMRDEAAFIHWLSRIAEHQIRDAADYHGAQKRDSRREVPLNGSAPDGERRGPDPVAPQPLPIDELSGNEQAELLDQCLLDMCAEYRELILLRDFEGLSWQDIAEETGRPSPDAARMKYGTARVELTKRMKAAQGS